MTAREIQRIVAAFYEIPIERLRGKERSPRYARPRHVAQFLTRELLSHSYPQIGREFQCDHTTVLFACRRLAVRMVKEPDLAQQVTSIRALLSSAPIRSCCEACGRPLSNSAIRQDKIMSLEKELELIRGRVDELSKGAA